MAESVKGKLKTGNEKKELLIQAIYQHKDVKEIKLIMDDFEKNGQALSSVVNCDHHSNFQNCILLKAVKTKKVDLIELLLSRGLCTEDKKIQDLLVHEAITIGDLSVMQILSEHGFLLSTCDHEIPPLFQLVTLSLIYAKKKSWIQLFYRAGVSFKEKNKAGSTLMHKALDRYNKTPKRLIRLLLYWGVNLEDRDKEDLTPLHFLAKITSPNAKFRNESMAKLFLKFGANPNAWSESLQQSVLETAIDCNQPKLVQLLLMYGANLNVKNWHECYALKHYVSQHDEFGIRLIVKEYIRLEYHNEVFDPGNLILQEELGNYYYVYKSLLEELGRIKIADGVDALDIIMANERKLTRYMRNPKISESIDSLRDSVYMTNDWNDILKFRAKKGKERAILMLRCKQPFREILKWEAAPILVIDKIFSYLSHCDLLRFYTAFYPASFLERLLPKNVKGSEAVESKNIQKCPAEDTDDEKSCCSCETDTSLSSCNSNYQYYGYPPYDMYESDSSFDLDNYWD